MSSHDPGQAGDRGNIEGSRLPTDKKDPISRTGCWMRVRRYGEGEVRTNSRASGLHFLSL